MNKSTALSMIECNTRTISLTGCHTLQSPTSWIPSGTSVQRLGLPHSPFWSPTQILSLMRIELLSSKAHNKYTSCSYSWVLKYKYLEQ